MNSLLAEQRYMEGSGLEGQGQGCGSNVGVFGDPRKGRL